MAFVLIVVIWFMRRLTGRTYLIRVGAINGASYGALAIFPELYLSGQELGLLGHPFDRRQYVDIWYFATPPCNRQLERILRKSFRIVPPIIGEGLSRLTKLIPMQVTNLPHPGADRCLHDELFRADVLSKTAPHLVLTEPENDYGKKILEEHGIPADVKLVCFASRDSAYLATVLPMDFSYHDYRNTDINKCTSAMDYLKSIGYQPIRMGRYVANRLTTSSCIDYAASSWRDDLLDLYIPSQCAFFVAPSSGIIEPAHVYRKPTLYLNVVPYATIAGSNYYCFYMPKLYFSNRLKRYLTTSEIFAMDSDLLYRSIDYEKKEIIVEENSAEDICECVADFCCRGIETPRDIPASLTLTEHQIQCDFFSLWPEGRLPNDIKFRIAPTFLKKYSEFLLH